MGDVGGLLRLLGSKRKNAVPRYGISGWMIALFGLWALVYVISCASAASDLKEALRAGLWDSDTDAWLGFLAHDIVPGLFVTFLFALFIDNIRSGISRRYLLAAMRIMRFVAADSNDSLAPPATWLLDELHNVPVPSVPTRLGLLPPLTVDKADVFVMVSAGFFVSGVLCVIFGPLLALASLTQEAGPLAIGLAITNFVVIAGGVILLCIDRRLRRPLILSADENGLRWTPPGRGVEEIQVRWSEARSFFLVQYIETVPGIHQHVAFVLDAPDTTLIWDERTTNKPEALGVSDALCALILARTSLPLRDLTGITVKLASPRWKPAYADLPTAFWHMLPGDDPTAPILPVPTTRWKLTRPALYVALPMLLIIAVLSAVGFILPH